MRRWNGWGDESISDELPAGGADAILADVLAGVPASRLPRHRLVVDDPETRVRHARRQSLPDWVALRTGRLGAVPDGIAFPNDRAITGYPE